MRPLRICLCASEVAPYAKTGGLADVITGLGRFLARTPAAGGAGHDVRLFVPFYGRIAATGVQTTPVPNAADVELRLPGRTLHLALHETPLPDSRARLYLVDCPELYAQEDLYTEGGDEALRFAVLSRAVLESCQRLQWAPDVIHCNDWHTALVPLYLKTLYAWDRLFQRTRTLLTIHNIGYQGTFAGSVLERIGLGQERPHLHQGDLREGRVSFLKTGVLHAHRLTTVSRTYAREILTPEFGMGIDTLLRARPGDLVGIVNGVDYGEWDPARDPHLPHRYSAADLRGKARMKQALLARFSLPPDPKGPLLGVVSRLASQKGFDLFTESLPPVLRREDVRLCLLGAGEAKTERDFQWLRDTWPAKVAFYRGYHEELAHWIEAGSDVFLMPSRYEPCGLNQMYSLRYGTPPLVRRTGGLADTVEPWDPVAGRGTGFVFDEYSGRALLGALEWVLRNWRDQPRWARLVQNGMAQDFSWDRQGPEYVALYRSLAAS